MSEDINPLDVRCPVCGQLRKKPCMDFADAPLRGEFGAKNSTRGSALYRKAAGTKRPPHAARIALARARLGASL